MNSVKPLSNSLPDIEEEPIEPEEVIGEETQNEITENEEDNEGE